MTELKCPVCKYSYDSGDEDIDIYDQFSRIKGHFVMENDLEEKTEIALVVCPKCNGIHINSWRY